MQTDKLLARREFLKTATQATAAVAVCQDLASTAVAAAAPSAGPLPVRILGKTGLKVPMLGYGGAALPKVWFNPLSREDRVALVRYAYDRGLRYFDKALALIASGGFDLCMLSYGYIPRGHDQIWSARTTALRDACLAKAHELGMGIVAMKVIGCGMLGAWSGYMVPDFEKNRLRQLPAAAIRFVLQDPRVHVLAIGMRLTAEIDANLQILTGNSAYTPEDRAVLADFSARLFDTAAIKKLKPE